MNPSWGSATEEISDETQFLLVRLFDPEEPNHIKKYAIFLPILSGAFRASIHSQDGKMYLKAESGDANVVSKCARDICYLGIGSDPYNLIRDGFAALSEKMPSFRVREQKSMPESLDWFGWCTWDAFYSDVDGPGIISGVKKLKAGGAPPRFIIIDDGWQDTTTDASAKKTIADAKLAKRTDNIPFWNVVSVMKSYFAGLLSRILGSIAKPIWRYHDEKVAGAKNDSLHVWLFRKLSQTIFRHPLLSNELQTNDWTKRLHSSKAGPRFLSTLADGCFKDFIDKLKQEEGIRQVYCWHALFGYWSGVHRDVDQHVDPSQSAPPKDLRVQSTVKQPGPSEGILQVEPSLAWNALALNGIGLPSPEKTSHFYDSLHSYLASCNVDGVKVDGQAAATMMGSNIGGSTITTRSFVKAMEESVKKHFGPENCINCMCHPTECLYSYKDTAVARASDDFWPRDEPSHTTHIAHIAYNSLFIGEIVQPDWDMFQSKHCAAGLHAAARAVGGCAVYVSDKPGEHNFDVLKRLVLPDGSVLRAKLPGRPTCDCLFSDVVGDGMSALKIWNRNAKNGVLGAFNIQGAAWDRQKRVNALHTQAPGTVEGVLRPSDVEGLVTDPNTKWAILANKWSNDGTLQSSITRKLGGQDQVPFSLLPRQSIVATVAQVHRARSAGGEEVEWAALGLEEMLNGGGAVLDERCVDAEVGGGSTGTLAAEVTVRGEGTLLVHCEREPATVLLNGSPSPASFSREQQALRVPFKTPSARASAVVTLLFLAPSKL